MLVRRLLVLGAVLALTLWFFARSDLWGLRTIEVRGNTALSSEEIIRLSNLILGQNLWGIDKEAVRENLLRHPRVREVTLRRRLPDTVVLEVQERIPLGVIPAAGAYWEVDREGRVLGSRPIWAPGDPLLLTGVAVTRAQLVPGNTITLPDIRPVLAVAEALPAEVRERIQEVHLAGAGGVCLYTREGVRVNLGETVDLEKKIALFWALYGQERENGGLARLSYIDVSRPKAPALGYADPG
ncbi:MAG: cell division protein FtsQ/DivIB [Moorellales bacterium]